MHDAVRLKRGTQGEQEQQPAPLQSLRQRVPAQAAAG